MSNTHAADLSGSAKNERRLAIVFGMTMLYLLAEVAGGVVTGSLALLADAGHMLTDVAGLGLALLAIRFAKRPASASHSYGYYRVEILAALFNALVLFAVSGYVLYEAFQRFRNPPEVSTTGMLIVAAVGLIINITGVVMLRGASDESLNMKGAYFEVLSDLLTSIGVIVAAVVMIATNWYYADPIISAGIGLFIIPRTWILLRDAVNVLLEAVPSDVNVEMLRRSLRAVPGVEGVHDLHVWSLTSGVNAMSVHVVAAAGNPSEQLLAAVSQTAAEEFKIRHTTVQVEPPGWGKLETHL
jgi:cobalt-zinc-cadmium efflux system protein